MKRIRPFIVLTLFIACAAFGLIGIARAAEPTFKDIKTKPKKFFDQEIIVVGKVLHPVVQIEHQVLVVNLKKGQRSESSLKINVYLVDDGTDKLLVATLKTLEKESGIQVKAKLLTTSRYGAREKAVTLFQETMDPAGVILKGNSAYRMLDDIVSHLRSYKPWVMLIDIEGSGEQPQGEGESLPQEASPSEDAALKDEAA